MEGPTEQEEALEWMDLKGRVEIGETGPKVHMQQPAWLTPPTDSPPPWTGGLSYEALNEPLMCSHAYANEERGHWASLALFPLRMATGYQWARGEERNRKLKAGLQTRMVALEGCWGRSQV